MFTTHGRLAVHLPLNISLMAMKFPLPLLSLKLPDHKLPPSVLPSAPTCPVIENVDAFTEHVVEKLAVVAFSLVNEIGQVDTAL